MHKRNLVLIYLESFETSFLSKEHGGSYEYEVIPEIYELLNDKDSIYFATDDNVRGTYNLHGTSWTTSSVISSTSGMPFKVQFNKFVFNEKNYLKKVNTLGDFLYSNGYYNEKR